MKVDKNNRGAGNNGPPDRPELAQFVAGDRDVFRQLFEQFRGDIFHVVRRFFASPLDQEEAFQEVWLQIYRNRGRFDVNRHQEFRAWCRRVARNKCIDLLKARTRRREVYSDRMDQLGQQSAGHGASASATRQALDGFIAGLDLQQREFFKLCLVQQRSHEEVARRMSITVRRSKYLKKKLVARMLKNRALREAAQP